MEKLLSIIVPVYNGEEHLDRCIQSILDQNYINMEIILIDDCSSDTSRKICEKFSLKDQRVKVFYNEKNMGIYETRNKGIGLANGEYITFVDDDDYIEKTMYQKMMQRFDEKERLDLVICNFINISENGALIGRSKEKGGEYTKEDIKRKFIYRLIGNQEISCAVWRCIFKKDKIMKHDIRFKASRVKDDMCFFLEYILNCEKLYCVEDCLYNYITYAKSTINTLGIGNIQDAMTVPNHYYEILKKYDALDSKIKNDLGIEYIKSYISIKESCSNKKEFYKNLNNKNFRKYMKWQNFFAMKGKQKIIYLALKLKIYCIL